MPSAPTRAAVEQAPCALLAWDTDFFGVRIARLPGSALDRMESERALDWCRENSIDCLYFLADSGDAGAIRAAEDAQFRLVDLRLGMRAQIGTEMLDRVRPNATVTGWEEADIPLLRSIASASHGDSRFYSDPNFPRRLCDKLYATWIEKSCRGYADHVLVARVNGAAAGYITCKQTADGAGEIGLLGVSENARGSGLGTALVGEALRWFGERGVESVTVVTQGRNIAAQRLYEKCSFRAESLGLWYHKWFTRQSPRH